MSELNRGETRRKIANVIDDLRLASYEGDGVISDKDRVGFIEQIMNIVDEIVEELESRGPASDEDEADAERRLSALMDPENVDLVEVDSEMR